MGTWACVTPVTSGIRILGAETRRETALRELKVSVDRDGAHAVELFGPDGKSLAKYRGTGPKEYSFDGLRSSGIHFVRVEAGAQTVTKRIFLY
jgi:hypothetical protein